MIDILKKFAILIIHGTFYILGWINGFIDGIFDKVEEGMNENH